MQKKTKTTPKSAKRNKVKIQTRKAYELTMKAIDELMKKGEKNLRPAELKILRALAEAAETYEDTLQPLPVPESLPDIVRYKLLQLHINQGLAAQLLGVSEAKFSLIMNGKQKPDINFIKAIHDKLEVDADVLLKAI
ncbi:MAG: transcriptional regulator [Bacteroidota bacterium]